MLVVDIVHLIVMTIEYVTFSTTGNAQDFGDLTDRLRECGGGSSSTRGLFAGGGSPRVTI